MNRIGRPLTCDCGECRKCKHREYMRRWYAKKTLDERRCIIARRNPAAARATEKRRYRHRKGSLQQVSNYTMNNAIRDGRLTRGPCAFCGTTVSVEGHHEDYSKPLDVIWLCTGCHQMHHHLARGMT